MSFHHRLDIDNPTLFNGLYKRPCDAHWQVVRELGLVGTYATPALAEAAAKRALINDAKALERAKRLKCIMSLVELYFRRPVSHEDPATDRAPDQTPEWLGAFLVMQFLDGHHWEIPIEQFDGYVADVPSKLLPIMKFWMLIYITCLFRWAVIAECGDLFATKMMATVHQSIAKHPWGNFNLANAIGFWIARIDDMIKYEVQQSPITGEKIYGQVYCAANSFLIFDPASPYHLRSDVDPHDFDEVIFALGRLEDDMRPVIQYFAESFAGTC